MSNKYTLAFYLFEQAAIPAAPAPAAEKTIPTPKSTDSKTAKEIADATKLLGVFGKDLEDVKKTGSENKKNLANVLKIMGKSPEKPTNSLATTGPTLPVGPVGAKPAGAKPLTASAPAGPSAADTGIGDLTKKIDGIEKILSDKSDKKDKKDGITWTTVKEHIVLKVLDRLLLRIL